jgi:hypothetical protein
MVPGLAQLIAWAVGVAIAVTFFAGVALRVVGGLLHRPFWKVGARLIAASVAALVIWAGLVSLAFATAFPWTGSDRVEALIFVAVGTVAVAAGVLGVRWAVRYDLPDAPWQGTGHVTQRH